MIEFYKDLIEVNKYLDYNVDENSYFGPINSPFGIFDVLKDYLNKSDKFIDIGCGYGNIVRTLNHFGFNASGIERNKDLNIYHSGLDIYYLDFLKEDFDIKDYNLIYLYRPILCQKQSELLLEKIYKNSSTNVKIVYLEPHDINQSYFKLLKELKVNEFRKISKIMVINRIKCVILAK